MVSYYPMGMFWLAKVSMIPKENGPRDRKTYYVNGHEPQHIRLSKSNSFNGLSDPIKSIFRLDMS